MVAGVADPGGCQQPLRSISPIPGLSEAGYIGAELNLPPSTHFERIVLHREFHLLALGHFATDQRAGELRLDLPLQKTL